MKTFITIIKLLFAVFVIIGTIYIYAEYRWPLLGALVAMLLLPCISIVSERNSGFIILTAIFLFCSTWFYLGIGLRAIHHKDSKTVDIVTPFYPIGPSLATGIRLDTLRLAQCIDETYFGKYKVKSAEMYLLTTKDSLQIIFSNSGEVLSGRKIHFESQKTPWGNIDVCSFIDNNGVHQVYDLWGHDIHSTDYTLPILEYRPEFYYTY